MSMKKTKAALAALDAAAAKMDAAASDFEAVSAVAAYGAAQLEVGRAFEEDTRDRNSGGEMTVRAVAHCCASAEGLAWLDREVAS